MCTGSSGIILKVTNSIENMNISTSNSFNEICGAIHIHTTFSDGGVSYEELIKTAQTLKLDYIIATDHMSLGGRDSGFEGFHDNLCVLIGYEHHDPDIRNHYLAIGSKKVHQNSKKPQEYIDAVKKDGGIGFLAHPAEKRHYFSNLPPYPWNEWQVSGYDGLEIWNQMSDWMEQIRSYLPQKISGFCS